MKRGFTLVEIVLAMTLFSAMGMSLVVLLSANLRSSSLSSLNSQIKAEGQYITRLFNQRARYATACTVSGTAIILTNFDGTQTTKFECVGSRFRVDNIELSPNNLLAICNLTCDASLNLTLTSSKLNLSQNFQSQITLRNNQN